MPKVLIEIGEAPCDMEGGCPMYEYCKEHFTDCHSFRGYVADKPRLGVPEDVSKSGKAYRSVADRCVKMRIIKPTKGE